MKKIRIKIRIILIVISVLILGWLVDCNFVLTKPLEIVYDFSRENGFISFLKPESRVSKIKEADGKFYQTMTSEPAYFELNLPLSFFKTAEVELKYKNPNQTVVELGLAMAKDSYDLNPLENKVLDKLSWYKFCEDNVCLWQRKVEYNNIESFLNNLPPLNKVGVYHYEINEPYFLPNYKAKDEYQELNYSLRGAHTFYTYLKDESADFIFTLEDMNRTVGKDAVKINFYDRNNSLIFSDSMIDDGNPEDNEVIAIPRIFKFQTPKLPEGVYRLEINTTDDVFIRQIKTKQQYLIFINKIYLGDTLNSSFKSDNNIKLFTNSKQIKAVTPHKEGLQTLFINSDKLKLEEVYTQYNYINNKNKAVLLSPKGDVLLQSNNLWFFDENNFFDPRIKRVAKNRDLEGLNFVIADYQPNQEKKVDFNLYNAYKEKGKIKFIISAPGLDIDKNQIDVEEIKIIVDRTDFSWDNFKKFISKIYE